MMSNENVCFMILDRFSHDHIELLINHLIEIFYLGINFLVIENVSKFKIEREHIAYIN